jgi:nucleotide sugar dehydrogenase
VNVAVVGLGKVGLPLAVQYAGRGLSVTGCDIDQARVDQVNAGECPIVGETELEERLADAVKSGNLHATTDTTLAVAESDVVVLIVPVGLDDANRPDFAHIDGAVSDIARGLRPETLVLVETTVPVGTTRERIGAALSKGDQAPLLAASPERVSSGTIFRDLKSYPKIIGAIDDASWSRAEEFYTTALEAPGLIRVRDPETAELSKVAEGIYRDVNIALASELARYADTLGVDVVEAIAAANSQPYSHLHQPGVGVGGHCIPVYPHFLPADVDAPLTRAARDINDRMAAYGVSRLETALGSLSEKTVLILGVAYRADVREAAHSSALLLAEALRDRGATPLAHDPYFSDDELRRMGLEPAGELPPEHVDAVIVQAWHTAYHDLDVARFPGCRAVLDGRNSLGHDAIEAAGVLYVGIGR